MHSCRHRAEARQCTFQTEKEWGSTTVGCTTSLPGNTPHVTAFTLDCPTLLRTCTIAHVMHTASHYQYGHLLSELRHCLMSWRILASLLIQLCKQEPPRHTLLTGTSATLISLTVCVLTVAGQNGACQTCLCPTAVLACHNSSLYCSSKSKAKSTS